MSAPAQNALGPVAGHDERTDLSDRDLVERLADLAMMAKDKAFKASGRLSVRIATLVPRSSSSTAITRRLRLRRKRTGTGARRLRVTIRPARA